MSKDNGGPAFPCKGITGYKKSSTVIYSNGHPGEPVYGDFPGMSLRDHFAGLAMQALVTGAPYDQPLGHTGVAQVAYSLADAMLDARK